jgi:hypothetical protein
MDTTAVRGRLPATAEGPQPLVDLPLWSENYCYTGWDAEQRIGIFLHQGRTPVDPELWHEIVSIHLPDGRILLGKNFSYGTRPDGPDGSLLKQRCEDPFRAWSLSFAGPLRVATDTVLAAGPLPDGPQPGVRLDLAFTSDKPVWDFGGGDAGGWARLHYQQLGSFTGRLVAEGVDVELNLIGWRDHSLGPRNMEPFLEHALVTAQFEDGRSLYAVTLKDTKSDAPLVLGRLDSGAQTTELALDPLPTIDDTHGPSRVYEFSVPTDAGPAVVRAEMQCILPSTMFPPNDMVLGLSPGPGAYVLWMGQARITFDGTVGYGHVERAARVWA